MSNSLVLSIVAINENKVSSIERKSFLTEKNGESKEVPTIGAARDSFCRHVWCNLLRKSNINEIIVSSL